MGDESCGVGNISACPDPDDGGPEFARLGVGPTGKANTRCVQGGYRDKNAAGDDEFHARLNSTKRGQQTGHLVLRRGGVRTCTRCRWRPTMGW